MTRTRIRLLAAVLLPLLVGCKTPREASDASVLVHCVTPDGAPVSGARIVWLDDFGIEPTGFCEALQNLGARTELAKTDADGRAGVACEREGFLVAESASCRGALMLSERPRHVEVVMWPKESVDVTVVDQEGRPVEDVPVYVVMTTTGGGQLHWSFGADTDSRGVCRIEGLELCARTFPGDQEYELGVEGFEVGVSALLPGLRTQHLPVEEGRHAVRFTLPPSAAVRVRCPDVEGEAFAHLACAQFPNAFGVAEIRDGVAEFPWVGLGLPLEVRLHDRIWSGEQSFAGPTQSGERVEIDLPAHAEQRRVRARLLDAEGEPIARTRFVFVDQDLQNATTIRFDRSDAEGRLEVIVDADCKGLWFLRDDSVGSHRIHSWIEIPAKSERVLVDLGSVAEGEGKVLAEGRVVDASGAAVAGATLRILEQNREHGWPPRFCPSTRSGPDGRFRIVGPALFDAGDHGIQVDSPNWLSPGYDVREIEAGQAIVARSLGSISFPTPSVDPRGEPALWMEITLQDESGRTVARTDDRIVDGRGSGRTLFPQLEPGTYSIAIENELVHATFDDLVVEAGRETRDPRLEHLEPQDLAHWVRIRVRGPGGRELDPYDVRAVLHRPDDPEVQPLHGTISRGVLPACFVAPIPKGVPTTAEITAPGCRLQRIELEGSVDLDVELLPQYAMRLRVPGELPKLPEGTWLSAWLVRNTGVEIGDDWDEPEDAERLWDREPGAAFDFGAPIAPDGTLLLGGDRPGGYALHWIVCAEQEDEGVQRGESMLVAIDPEPVVIEDSDAEQLAVRRIPEPLVARAREAAAELLRSLDSGE